MDLSDAELRTRLAFAARIAGATGRRLLALRASGRWPDASVLGDVADQAADGYLQGCLRSAFPADGVLSEETADSPERLASSVTWIVDPLDGTKEYSQHRHDFAVHVGLAVGGRAVLGAVALPAIDRVIAGFCAGAARHAEVTGRSGEWPSALAPEPAGGPLRLACSRSHAPEWLGRFAQAIGGAELVPCGSVGFKVAMLLFGRADAYVHRRGLKEWDTCAPEAVARAAGWSVCRFDGAEQRYNQPDPRNDEFVVCRPALRERVLAGLAACARR